METITAEEARSLSNDNNLKMQERKKELDEALESCMVKIHNAAKVGSFKAKCHCRYDLIDAIAHKLRSDLGYFVSLNGYPMSLLSHQKPRIQTSMIEFEVTWR